MSGGGRGKLRIDYHLWELFWRRMEGDSWVLLQEIDRIIAIVKDVSKLGMYRMVILPEADSRIIRDLPDTRYPANFKIQIANR